MRRDSPRYGNFPKRRKSRESPWNRASPAFGKLWEHVGKYRVDLVEKSLEKENLPSAGMLSKKELLQVIDKELNADQVKDIDEDYDKTVGKENDITIKNLVNPKKMVIQTGTAKVEIDSDYADMVETKRIDGRLYLAVPLTSNDILVDGCAVRTEALSD